MQRLTGFDATFLYSETPTVLMHTLKVAVIDPPPPEPGCDLFARFREHLGRLLAFLRRQRRGGGDQYHHRPGRQYLSDRRLFLTGPANHTGQPAISGGHV